MKARKHRGRGGGQNTACFFLACLKLLFVSRSSGRRGGSITFLFYSVTGMSTGIKKFRLVSLSLLVDLALRVRAPSICWYVSPFSPRWEKRPTFDRFGLPHCDCHRIVVHSFAHPSLTITSAVVLRRVAVLAVLIVVVVVAGRRRCCRHSAVVVSSIRPLAISPNSGCGSRCRSWGPRAVKGAATWPSLR